MRSLNSATSSSRASSRESDAALTDPGYARAPGPVIFGPLLHFAHNVAQLFSQRLRGKIKLNEWTCLKFDLAILQIGLWSLAKLIGDTNPFSGQEGKHAG